MKHTSFSLIAFAAVCGTVAVSMSAVANEQVVSRTETTYTTQNERIMDGYTPLDEIDNSVKTSTRTYKVPAPATTQQAPVAIRDKELEVFIFLVKSRGRTVSTKEIYEAVWQEISLPSSNNTVTVHILNLRRKLEDNPSSPKLIRTVWGKGYQID